MCFLLLNGAIPKGLRSIKSSASILYSEVKLRPFWDLDLHLSSAMTIVSHALRCINNLAHAAMYTVSVVPILFCSPCELPILPVVIAEHLLSAVIAAVTTVIHPVFFALRTLSSMLFGYQETTEFDTDWGVSEDDEIDAWKGAMNPFIPSSIWE